MASNNIFDIDLEDFEDKVLGLSHEKPVLVDFWADWCGPCRFLDPVLKAVVDDYEGEVLLAKVEVDEGENMKLAGRFQVRGFPTILLFRDGEERGRFSSAQPKSFVENFIEEYGELG
ncbi:MAG: thioredoxin family protein [bacterium]